MTFPYDLEFSYSTPRRYGLDIGPSRLTKTPLSDAALLPTEWLSFIAAFTVPFSVFMSLLQHRLRSISRKLTLLYQDQPSWKSRHSRLYSQTMNLGSDTTLLTDRDQAILETLLHKVRCLTVEQVARTWWSGTRHPKQNARRRLQKLEEAQLVQRFTIVSHPEIELDSPLLRWTPDDPDPELGALSYQVQNRWRDEYRPVQAVIATDKASRLFGGCGGRHPRSSEETHDVHLASVYLFYLISHPELAATWLHEDIEETKPGQKIPDAIMGSDDSRTAVEFAGKYSKEKLLEFHEYCRIQSLPYEVW